MLKFNINNIRLKLLLSFYFRKNKDLIYITSKYFNKKRLYIPEFLKKKIFQFTYNGNFHINFHIIYIKISFSIYIKGLFKRL